MKSIKLFSSRAYGLILSALTIILSTSIVFANAPQSITDSGNSSQTIIELDHKATSGKTLLIELAGSEDEHFHGGELVIKSDGEEDRTLIARNIMSADLSDDGLLIAAWNSDNQIKLFNSTGKEMRRIGVHGASPIISPNKNYIAYNKLANTGSDLHELSETSPHGIAVYNLVTDKEDIVTTSSDDFQPVAFSDDMTKLYFNSTRPYPTTKNGYSNGVASLWMVDLTTKKVTRLTNTNEELVMRGVMVPTLDVRALWSSDNKTAISSTDSESGIWRFDFNDKGMLVNARKIASGTSPRWSNLDNKIKISTEIDGQVISQELSVQ